ncbi:MAG: hypothetical protein ACXW3D_08525 [Caulobacteraceae bacterium]
MRTVTSVTGDVLSCELLDPVKVSQRAAESAATPKPSPQAPPEEDPFKNLTPLTFVSITGRPIRVDYHTEPFISIQYSALAAVRLCAVVRREDTGAILSVRDIADLPTADILKIDQRAIACMAKMLKAKKRRDQAVILPLSLQTTSMVKGRMALAALAADPNLAFKLRGLVEIYDTTLGAPPSRVTELISLLKASCRGVILHAPTSAGAATALKYCGQHGLAVSAEWSADPRAIAMRMLELGENLKGLAPMLAAFDLPSPLFIGVAQTAGFTHASIKPAAG